MSKASEGQSQARPNAISLLTQDHRTVESLFSEFEAAKDKRGKTAIVRRICAELDAHAKVEEKIFYPAVKGKVKDLRDTVNEGIVEHAAVKRLVRELSKLPASDEFFEPKVTVLKEFVQHHVKEEESEVFPKVASSGLDLDDIGEKIAMQKERIERRR